MRRKNKEESEETKPDPGLEDEPEGVFDVDEYEAPESGEFVEEEEQTNYFEDGDLYVEDEEVEGEDVEGVEAPLADEVEQAPLTRAVRRPPRKREPGETIERKLKRFWVALAAEARKVELPGAPDTRLTRIGTVAAIVLASLAVGAGTYLLGRGSGVDVDQARLQGEAAGLEAGAIDGAAQGYAAGFAAGQRRGFRKAYVPAYRLYYKRAYEQAGLDPPTSKQIEVPLP